MKQARIKCVAALLVLALGVSVVATLPTVAKESDSAVVSYGLNVLSAMTDVAVSVPIGNEAVFSADVFARGMNLSKVDYITVKTLPPVTDGELLLGSSRVAAGQTISGGNLSHLSLCAADDAMTHTYFTFTVNGGATPTVCNVYFLAEENYTPTLSLASSLSLNVSTHKGLAAHGALSAYDPDGDTLSYEVVSYPKNGSLRLTDQQLGTYVYTPNANYVGTDAFSYVARDRYGNYSAMETVRLKVTPIGTSVTYADMLDSPYYNAALTLTEEGIMSGSLVGDRYYFDADGAVSRAEFLVMAMQAAGISDVPTCEKTVFYDDAEIVDSMRDAVAAAYEMDYISGSLINGKLCFLPNEAITRAQAAVILGNIVGLGDVPVIPTFADSEEIPVWAADAIYSLNAVGILTGQDGCIEPTATLTRGQTAAMLAAVLQYLE